jgi:outer membrane cobalamin receptor
MYRLHRPLHFYPIFRKQSPKNILKKMRKIFVVAALMTSSLLFAQTDSTILNEVVVTASKVPIKQSATGKVISVISRETIEKNVGRSLTQLLNEQAGITVSGALNNMGTPSSCGELLPAAP